ncbi:MAG TPA: hypothetical protein VFR68_14335 [Candidatus Dormibacteraeota bacterium]|nr:hypothetical protein [Candidatus Dormibacteraeota bacterium]
MSPTVRAASHTDSLVSEMRQMVQTSARPVLEIEDRDQLERSVSARIGTLLMVLLITIILTTSAMPDMGPSLAKVIQAHL